MGNFEILIGKIEGFIRKYYTNELIKGAILFFAIGLLYFLLTLFVEHLLWLDQTGRTILFWLFVLAEFAFFLRFIAIPLGKLAKLRKGINYKEASIIIGNHFPEVNDKLLNVLQLAEDTHRSELLLASIEQKSIALRPIPFSIAVNFRKNLKYVKFALIPLFIVLLFWLSGNFSLFTESYERVVHYKLAYEHPAPFQFYIVNDSLEAIENKPFTLQVHTRGKVIPQEVQIHFNDESYFLQKKANNGFEYVFNRPANDLEFYFSGNDVSSRIYTLKVLKVPVIMDFTMELDYPTYTKKVDETIKSTGNAIVPQGTIVTWVLQTAKTDAVELVTKDTTFQFVANAGQFMLSNALLSNFGYQISTSNKNLHDYENLGFTIDVVKDEHPEMRLKSEIDSVTNQSIYFFGQLSDDYGLSKLQLVYYPQDNELDKSFINININSSNFEQFYYAFPEQLKLVEGTPYSFYFEVFDNDQVHGAKSVKSPVFNYRKLTQSEIEEQQLKRQKDVMNDFGKTLNQFNNQKSELQELSKSYKEKSNLNYNDKKKLDNFLDRQQQQEQLMQKFSEQLQQNLNEFQKEESLDDEYKKLLQERLERQQLEFQRNEKLLDELNELTEKINQEQLTNKLNELAKQQQNNKRNLEQILELTKQYYVKAKAEKIRQDLEDLAKRQEERSNRDTNENTQQAQDSISKEFKKIQEELDLLDKDNQQLKKPVEFGRHKEDEKTINQEQQNASEHLKQAEEKQKTDTEKQSSFNKAKQSQKKAAKKLKELSQQMKSQMGMSSSQTMEEDAEMLRQILDNLIVFSFDQEELMNLFQSSDESTPNFSKNLAKQYNLKELFGHIDDSLFALSLRQPEIGVEINKNITDVYYNMQSALERFSENQYYQGIASQHYSLTAANELSDFLSDVLDNMQQSLSGGSGNGKGKDNQLPDIIQSQEQLNDEMGKGIKKGANTPDKPGEEGPNGKQKSGNGTSSEEMSEQLFGIFKQQQLLRQELEKQLENSFGNAPRGNAEKIVKEMERVEQEILEKGFNENTWKRMMNLKHELLKLDNASFHQGEKEERESHTNFNQFNTKASQLKPAIQQYFKEVEILNRQVLPLRQIYKRKVQEYFKSDD